MPSFSAITRIHVLSAIRDHDQLGATTFLETYGFEPSREYVLKQRGRSYTPMAILGAAHKYATGTPATIDDFTTGNEEAAKWLSDLGFDVLYVDPNAGSKPAARARTPRTSTRTSTPKAPAKPVKPEPEIKLCPRCYTAVPATGVCDYCD